MKSRCRDSLSLFLSFLVIAISELAFRLNGEELSRVFAQGRNLIEDPPRNRRSVTRGIIIEIRQAASTFAICFKSNFPMAVRQCRGPEIVEQRGFAMPRPVISKCCRCRQKFLGIFSHKSLRPRSTTKFVPETRISLDTEVLVRF